MLFMTCYKRTRNSAASSKTDVPGHLTRKLTVTPFGSSANTGHSKAKRSIGTVQMVFLCICLAHLIGSAATRSLHKLVSLQ